MSEIWVEQNHALKRKVKKLQEEIFQRTRNYMLRPKSRSIKPISTSHQSIQVNMQNFNLTPPRIAIAKINKQQFSEDEHVNDFVPDTLTMKSQTKQYSKRYNEDMQLTKQFYNNQLNQYKKEIEELKLTIEDNQSNLKRLQKNQIDLKERMKLDNDHLHNQIERIKDSYRVNSEVTRDNLQNLEQIMMQSQKITYQYQLQKQQLEKLRIQLDIEKQQSYITQQAILQSQEQNYQLKLQLKKAIRKIKNQQTSQLSFDIVSNKQSEIKPTQQLQMSAIKLHQNSMFQYNEGFRTKIFKDIFQIIRHLPIIDNQMALFQPENDTELFHMIEQIKQFVYQYNDRTTKTQKQVQDTEKDYGFLLCKIIQNLQLKENQVMQQLDSYPKGIFLKNYIKSYMQSNQSPFKKNGKIIRKIVV